MIKSPKLDHDPVWQKVWKEYYDRAEDIQEDHDTTQAHQVAMLCWNIEQSINYIIEYNDKKQNNSRN